MPRLDEMSEDRIPTLLLYGNSGTAKTKFIGTAGSDSVIISPAQGIATLQSKWFRETFKVNPIIEIVDEMPLPDVAKGYDRISDLVEKYLEDLSINTIIVDDATNFRRLALNKGLELNEQLNRSGTLAKMRKIKADTIVRELNDMTMEMSLVESFIKQACTYCKEAKKTFVMTAHERILFNPPAKVGAEDTVKKISPGFTGKTFPDDITGYFDLIWHTEVLGGGNQIHYQIRTQGDSKLVAKTRWAGLFPVIFEKQPLLSEIIQCVKTQTPITGYKA